MPLRVRSIFRRALVTLMLLVAVCAGGFLILALGGGSALHLYGYQKQIDEGTRAIAAATTGSARAAGYLQRGRGYAEIVRYRHVMRSVGADEYVRLYHSAMQDLDAAVELDPGDVATLNARGLTYFEHNWTAVENKFESGDAINVLLVRAKADFTAAIDHNAGNKTALDYRGMTNEKLGDYVAAIDDYTRVSAVDPRLGQLRLADLYCRRGSTWIRDKQYDKAAADLELSISLEANADACECDPYSQLLWVYFERLGDLDKSWALLRRAQNNRRWLMPELVDRLKTASPQAR